MVLPSGPINMAKEIQYFAILHEKGQFSLQKNNFKWKLKS
jgi:hypothetical protein